MDEFEVIKKYFHPLTNGCAQANNLQDDIAEISVPQGYKLVISKDLIVEDVHFKREYGGYKIASKLLRSNLSDLAAAGAKPLYYMLGFSKSAAIDEEFISDFHQALK
ncbi:MAG: AIR synthase related protein, partial [Proteobacteria bacterium]|nr:AIR synthase related protein [Pseudomonadota bacterium]